MTVFSKTTYYILAAIDDCSLPQLAVVLCNGDDRDAVVASSADQNANNGPMKILNAPINLGALAENMVENTDEQAAVWMINKRHNSSVRSYTRTPTSGK